MGGISAEKSSEVLEKLVSEGKKARMITLKKVIVVIMRAAVYTLRISVRRT